MIEVVLGSWEAVKSVFAKIDEAAFIVAAMSTQIHAQRLDENGERTGTDTIVLTNDQQWEGHLIERPWVTPQDCSSPVTRWQF